MTLMKYNVITYSDHCACYQHKSLDYSYSQILTCIYVHRYAVQSEICIPDARNVCRNYREFAYSWRTASTITDSRQLLCLRLRIVSAYGYRSCYTLFPSFYGITRDMHIYDSNIWCKRFFAPAHSSLLPSALRKKVCLNTKNHSKIIFWIWWSSFLIRQI